MCLVFNYNVFIVYQFYRVLVLDTSSGLHIELMLLSSWMPLHFGGFVCNNYEYTICVYIYIYFCVYILGAQVLNLYRFEDSSFIFSSDFLFFLLEPGNVIDGNLLKDTSCSE